MSYQSKFIIILFILQPRLTDSFKCELDGFFPDQRDCWVYHICVGTTHSVKACQDDLLFNPIKKECDWAINVNCTSFFPESIRPIQVLPGSELNNSSPFDSLCQLIDNDYIAHPTDCKQYAYCANGVPQPKLCKKTLMWSQTEKMCVWPAQSDCPVKYPTTTTTATTTTSTTALSTSFITRRTTYLPAYIRTDAPSNTHQSSVICPPTQSRRIADPYDCTIYHDCYHGTDLISYCPAYSQYNPEKQTCDHARNVQCVNKCTMKNEGARFLDPRSCCHFYECISNELIPQTCPQPNLFDSQTRQCLPYKKVNCDGRRQCLNKCHYLSNRGGEKSKCDVGQSCAGRSDGFYLDRTKPNCQSYIQCLDHRVANHSRCLSNQRFNRNLGRCTPADQVPCLASAFHRISWLIFLLRIFLPIDQYF